MKTNIKKLLCFLMISTLSLALVACGPKPEESVKSFFNALQKQDIKTAVNFVENGDSTKLLSGDANEDKIINQVFSKVKYEIVSSTVSGNTATVKAKVTSSDLVKITSKMVTDLMPTLMASAMSGNTDEKKTDQLIEEYFIKNISASDAPMTTTNVDIKLIKSNDKKTWLIQGNDDLANALTGNISKAFSDISSSEKTTK